MSLLICEGFEYSSSGSTYTAKFWDGGSWTIDVSQIRYGNYSAQPGNPIKNVNNLATVIVGFGLYFIQGGEATVIDLRDSTTVQVSLTADNLGKLRIYRGASTTLLETSSLSFSPNSWVYIELKVTINDTTGAYEVRVKGTDTAVFLQGTGVDTQVSANSYITNVKWGNTTDKIDDIYICDTNGSKNNDFLGDCKVIGYLPNAAGDSSQWTPSAGSNYQNVDDTQPDDDTTYNSSATATNLDLYNIADASITGTIHGIQLSNYMRKDDAGARTVKNAIKSGTTTAYGSNEAMGDSYDYYHTIWEDNPDDSLAWEDADIDALQIGAEIVS